VHVAAEAIEDKIARRATAEAANANTMNVIGEILHLKFGSFVQR
jgi:hypothetical protein